MKISRNREIHQYLISINERIVKRLQKYRVQDSLEWWQFISEKRCDDYAHSPKDDYNEALKAFL
jgi:hypothetical protein